MPSSSTLFADESSHVSFLLDQEEYTLQFDENTTIEKIEVLLPTYSSFFCQNVNAYYDTPFFASLHSIKES